MLFDRMMEKGNIRPNNASLVNTFTACAEHKIKGLFLDYMDSAVFYNDCFKKFKSLLRNIKFN